MNSFSRPIAHNGNYYNACQSVDSNLLLIVLEKPIRNIFSQKL